ARHAEGAGCAAEYEISPSDWVPLLLFWAPVLRFEAMGRGQVTGAEIRQAGVDDVEGAEEVGLELVADVVVVLVFTGADDAIAGAVGDDVDAAEVGDGLLDHGIDCGSDADITEERQMVLRGSWEGRLQQWDRVLVQSTYYRDEVIVGEGGFCNGTANVA
ncbi:MAG: hypothetical protein L6R39_004260, partial [Caloplaca ligustica]